MSKSVFRVLGPSAVLVGLLAACSPNTPARDHEPPSSSPGIPELATLALPAGAPAHFEVSVPLDGVEERLVLVRHSVRAPDTRLEVYHADGTMTDEALPAVRTYRGHVAGRPELSVVASRTAAGLHAHVLDERDARWTIRPAAGAKHEVHVGRPDDEPELTCGQSSGLSASAPTVPGIDPEPREICQFLAQIAFDADYEFYLAQGGTVEATVDRIESHLNLVDFYYARDVQITHELTAVVVRTAPFYDPVDGGHLLDLFTTEWNDNMGHVERDLAHLMTGKSGSLLGYGGLAWVGTVCSWLQYAWSADSANIVGHEMGHNWGAGHCHDLEPPNNMCGGAFYIAPNTKDIIVAHRDSRTCIDPWRPYTTQVPPYAHPDGIKVRKDQYDALDGIHFDVLANDHDGNCVPVVLDGHDGTTPAGGTLSISVGTGPEGRDELVYAPPTNPFLGVDSFGYLVGDGTSGQATGTVHVEVQPVDLAGWWRLDDAAGNLAFEESAHGRDGTVHGGAAWTTGPFSGALELDGIDDYVATPTPLLNTNTVTLTAWIRRNGDQGGFAGIVFCRGATTRAGLNFRGVNELGYHWAGAGSGWSTGLVPPDGQWVFVALVVEPTVATIYMHDGTAMQSATNVIAHGPELFDGEITLGLDDNGLTRYATMAIDDVRVFGYALTAAELDELVVGQEKAQAPDPLDGGSVLPDDATLTWKAGFSALSHDVYFGLDWSAVRSATTGSPEYMGNFLATEFDPGTIDYDTTYFWRVDVVTGSGVVKGDVWQFTAADWFHWRLDETSGTIAAEDRFGVDGTYKNGVVLGEAGAAASTGTAVAFDGVNDVVEITTPLDLETDRVTISGWLWREGTQTTGAGVVYSRAGSTAAGVKFIGSSVLGYDWNDDASAASWSSGLSVPHQTWVFFALVVEPRQATMYLGNGGTLSSSVHSLHHGIEEFDGRLDFARNNTTPVRRFVGKLDDVRLHQGAMSPSQVDALYQSY